MVKKTIAVLSAVLLAFWGISVVKTNKNEKEASKIIYPMGEWVCYENDFYEKSSDTRNGYSIKVVDARVVKYDDFLSEQGIKVFKNEESFTPDCIFDVTVIIKNANNTDGGISMIDTTLNSVNDIMQIDFDVFDALYEQLGGAVSFSLKTNTQMEFHFPFKVANAQFQKVCDYEYLTKNTFYLNLSQYPTEKSIEVKSR